MKTIVVCADDYGLSGGVCDGIEELVALGRLSATGAMTGLPAWRRHGPGLRRLVATAPADVGLHLTLTEQRPLTRAHGIAVDGRLPRIGALIRQAYARRLPAQALRDEIEAQLDAFEEVWGGPPDFVDGHQHAHVLPGVRAALIEVVARRYPSGSVWLRHCAEPLPGALRRGHLAKVAVIGALSRGLDRDAAKAGIPTNDSFRGLYDFSDRVPFRQVFRRALAGGGNRILVHCHPGRVDAELRALDPLLEPRERELAYLASPACAADFDTARRRPGRFAALAAGPAASQISEPAVT